MVCLRALLSRDERPQVEPDVGFFFFFSTSAGPRRSVSLEVVGIHFQSAVKFRFQLLQLVFSSSQSAAGRFCTDSSLAANHD